MNASILTLGCYQSTGGPSRSVKAFQRALNARVVAWVDPVGHAAEQLVFDAAAVVHGLSLPVAKSFLYPRSTDLKAAEEVIATSDFVSCHLFWRWHVPWMAEMSRKHRVPYWLVPHGGLDPYVMQTNGIVKRLFAQTAARRFLNNVSALVCATRREYEKARRFAPDAKPVILPWPLDDADFRSRDADSRLAMRRMLEIPEDARCLMFLGRLHPMKRPLETITALAQSGAASVHLILIGNPFGITEADCSAHASRLGVADRVHVVGPVFGVEKHRYFDAADIFISLSHRENFNFAAAESMAAGLPVILSPGNDLSSDLAEVNCGWLLSRDDMAASAIADAATMPASHLEAMGSRGQRWAEQTLGFDTFQSRLSRAAERLIAHNA